MVDHPPPFEGDYPHEGEHPRQIYLPINSAHAHPSATASTTSPAAPTATLPGVAAFNAPPIPGHRDNATLAFPHAAQTQIPPVHDLQPQLRPFQGLLSQPSELPIQTTTAELHTAQVPPVAAVGQRQLRVRRKVPSCDACRERKCDHNHETNRICSECRSRNVECLFMQESNRRGNQRTNPDCERLLREANQQNARLEERIEELLYSQTKSDATPASTPGQTADEQTEERKRRRLGTFRNASMVASNLRLYGEGIFRADFSHKAFANLDLPLADMTLPPREFVEQTLNGYISFWKNSFPFFDPESYRESLNEIYQGSTGIKDTHAIVLVGFFAISGVGIYPVQAEKALHQVLAVLGTPSRPVNLNTVRALTFAALALIEGNLLSSAYQVTGQAIRAAQELGLNYNIGIGDREELERLVLWYSLCCVEISLAVQLGLPTMFTNEGHRMFLDSAIEQLSEPRHARLLTNLNFARAALSVNRVLTSLEFNEPAMVMADERLNRYTSQHPPETDMLPRGGLKDSYILAAIRTQDHRLLLHRQKIRVNNDAITRLRGLEDCVQLARGTVDLLRAMQRLSEHGHSLSEGYSRSSWTEEVSRAASTYLCRSLWRCFLFLVLLHYYDDAKICAEVCAAIGTSRAANEPCGRYAEFFLGFLDGKSTTIAVLVEDDELMTYVSADMQGNLEEARAWQEDAHHANVVGEHAAESDRRQDIQPGAWNRVVERLQTLITRNRSELQAIQLPSRTDARANAGQQSSPSTRMSIADII